MDIASITEFNGKYGSRLMNKNNQILRARMQSGDISDSLCLYFHDATMFHEQQLINDMEWYEPSEGSSTLRPEPVFGISNESGFD